jgi:2-oxo-3-hexenedioate decarboxylase
MERDAATIARELAGAFEGRRTVPTPSSVDQAFDLTSAYAVENELARMRGASGRQAVGVKVGYANKAVWRALKLDTLVWARIYDDTVQYGSGGSASLSIGRMIAPKIEPEIVFRLKHPVGGEASDAAAVLDAVDWLALAFEIIDCPYPDWTFQPVDFVAAYGLHAALVVGEPVAVANAGIAVLAEQLANFKVRLLKGDHVAAEGSGRNSLRSPALCLGELAAAMARRGVTPLAAGDLVSSGTLTGSHPISAGETWRVEADGIEFSPLTLATVP